jgi:hypothetical protein
MGAVASCLSYVDLAHLIELKLAAGRARDQSDVVELLRASPEQEDSTRQHLSRVHEAYVGEFDRLAHLAREQHEP